ncbi:MAG: haloacid dehalogenase-like hydrolase [Erysipelotrichales bacterium]|nr:haloacid dehalogenase-like hydrolase [Erysipelotrichales bacterium]
MLNIKEGILEKINDWNDDFYVLADFDRTLTKGDSESSWGVLASSAFVPQEYADERIELYNYYRPIELDLSIDYETKNKYMIEWWTKHIGLLIKYSFKEEVINNDTSNLDVMKFRGGAKDFLRIMHEKNIPVIIISAGIGNFIEKYLIHNDSMYDNIHIVANFIKFENGVATGISNNIIHSLNKNEVSMPENIKELVSHKKNVLLLGDTIDDIKMVNAEKRETALKIGFLNESTKKDFDTFIENYDIVGYNDATFTELIDSLKIFK